MCKYLERVSGLGAVKALFLPSANTDAEARADSLIGAKTDPRRRTIGLYRIRRIVDAAPNGPGLYLHTGIKYKKAGDVLNRFFFAKGDYDALMFAVARGWDTQNKLYHCEPIAAE